MSSSVNYRSKYEVRVQEMKRRRGCEDVKRDYQILMHTTELLNFRTFVLLLSLIHSLDLLIITKTLVYSYLFINRNL